MSLTHLAIRKAKPGDKPLKLVDGGGLYLLLTPTGARWWRWDYRRPVTGQRNTLSLGVYPDTSLTDARVKRDDARRQLAAGIDPGTLRQTTRKAKQVRAANSFEIVAREWFALNKSSWVESYSSKILLRLENDLFPWIGHRPIADIRARELLDTLNRVVQRGAIETAHRIPQNCNQIFRYASVIEKADRNPAADLKGALPSANPCTDLAAVSHICNPR